MKLIDMLVEDGLNGWQWPDGVECITQDNGSSIYKGVAFGYHKAPYLKKNIWLANNGTGHADAKIKKYDVVADDWDTAIITREQYESALAAKNEGWIEWGGGECPVPRGTLVDVRYLCGDVNRHIKAGEPDSSGSIDAAFAVRWSKLGAEYDIIAYRLHNTNEAEQAKSDDEADLNECIGQDVAPVWNGDGAIPPVGCECQYRKHKKSEQNEWFNGVVKYTSEFTVVIQPVCYPGETVGHPANFEFRPIRSEAERKRDDICDKIYGAMTNAKRKDNRSDMAEEIYDAIAAGKIPGVKLED